MANFILLLAILSATASFVAFNANVAGSNWGNEICSAASPLCHYPQQLAFAAAGLAALWIMIKFVSAVRN
jgi:hypothetical protein